MTIPHATPKPILPYSHLENPLQGVGDGIQVSMSEDI